MAVAIKVRTSSDWVTRLYLDRIYSEWLTEHNVDITMIVRGTDNLLLAVILEPEDALAFKLRFGL